MEATGAQGVIKRGRNETHLFWLGWLVRWLVAATIPTHTRELETRLWRDAKTNASADKREAAIRENRRASGAR